MGEVKLTLSSWNLDASPSEEASIDRPGPGSNQSQGSTDGTQQDVSPQIYRSCYSMPKLKECHHRSRDRRQ